MSLPDTPGFPRSLDPINNVCQRLISGGVGRLEALLFSQTPAGEVVPGRAEMQHANSLTPLIRPPWAFMPCGCARCRFIPVLQGFSRETRKETGASPRGRLCAVRVSKDVQRYVAASHGHPVSGRGGLEGAANRRPGMCSWHFPLGDGEMRCHPTTRPLWYEGRLMLVGVRGQCEPDVKLT